MRVFNTNGFYELFKNESFSKCKLPNVCEYVLTYLFVLCVIIVIKCKTK